MHLCEWAIHMAGKAGALWERYATAVHRLISRQLPNHPTFNYCLALPRFCHGNRRLPRRMDDPRATLNDIIFHRMIRDDWSALQQSCVDKEYAKTLAMARAPGVKAARTEAIFHLRDGTRVEEVAAWLTPYLGRKLVVKPTHSYGSILYLDEELEPARLARFVRYAKRNFFHAARETQYRRLEKKLIVEENLAPDQRLNDYKFTCADGRVLYGRMDVGRFTPDHRRALFTVPDFDIIPVRCGGLDFPERIVPPPHLSEMIGIAAQLSRGFDFVRVDLYDTPDGVYFGEFTFTPSAGACSYSDERIAIEMAQRLRAASAEQFAQNGIEPLAPGIGGHEPAVAGLEKTSLVQAS
ncbi:ATP-grasp fold amidoligase family protein [Dongia sp.]|uniref:ATP-grasp fold amidoligase family protein n=1 Tax=Dongia sp. TaxID=1977262 RepID=UPI0035AFE28E